MNVRDMMTRAVVSVAPQTPLKEVAALLTERRISGVPVVEAGGRIVGVVSEADFLRMGEGVAVRTAAEAMTSPAITIGPDEPLHQAAQLMSRRAVNRLPVVEDGRLVGILTRADIVRLFVRSDEDLRDQVAFALRAVDGLSVVGVRDGVVELSGTVQSEALVTIIRSIVVHLDGVVGVDDRNLTWLREPQALLG